MGVLITLALLALGFIIAKVVWLSGFMSGKSHEAAMWLDAIDKLFVPNWQTYPVQDAAMQPEQLEFANRLFSAAYRAALEQIKTDIANVRREAAVKALAKLRGDGA